MGLIDMLSRKQIVLLLLLSAGIIVLYACQSTPEPAKTEPPTASEEITPAEPEPSHGVRINSRTISATLKKRLQSDNLLELSGEDWEGNKWHNERIGRFYKYDDEVVQMVVAEQTNEILALTNRKLTRVAERRLRNKVNNKTRCSEAVDEMPEASFDSEPLRDIQ